MGRSRAFLRPLASTTSTVPSNWTSWNRVGVTWSAFASAIDGQSFVSARTSFHARWLESCSPPRSAPCLAVPTHRPEDLLSRVSDGIGLQRRTKPEKRWVQNRRLTGKTAMASVHATGEATSVELDELGLPVGTLEEQEFEDAASAVRGEIARGRTVPKETLLELYGLYKQSTVGDCFEEAPTIVNWAARQKWKAWKGRHGMTEEDAMGKYVEIVTRILPEWKKDSGNSIALGNVQARIQGTNEEVTEEDKQTLHGCARVGYQEELEALVAAGKDVNERDGEGRAPLHWAADKGHLAVVEFLLRHGADPNLQDEDGCTPLHNAVICKHRAVCECLCSAGADPTRADREGDSALEFWPSEWPLYQPIH